MSIEATYSINEYIKSKISGASLGTINFYPGEFASQGSGDSFIVYNVAMGTDFEFFMVHIDKIKYKLVHSNFDTLQRIVEIINVNLNVEDIEKLITESGIRFGVTQVTTSGNTHAIYLEGNNYWQQDFNITATYTQI